MYDIIKKQNGEHFAKAIRNYDNGIFDVPDIDKIVKYAGPDAEPIMNYLVSLKNIQIEEHAAHKDPIALLDKAGYNAYVADTLEKQNAIKKYYARGEELCTFRDPDRFKKYYIINAVRKDVDKIKREDFTKPERDDRYGTSVISIQVLKTGGFISIKNRYNHTVNNPDNTLNSNPDNIIPGLADAIKHHFNVDFSSRQVLLYGNYTLIDKQIYHYQGEQNNVYWSENSYLIDGHIVEINKDSQIMLGDGLLLDLKQKKVHDLISQEPYDFAESLNHAIENKTLQIAKNPQGGHDIFADKKRILTVKNAEIVNINIPDAHTITLSNINLRGDLDFTDVKTLDLYRVDLSHATSIKFPKETEHLRLEFAKLPAYDLDFGDAKTLDLDSADLSRATSIKFPKKMKKLHLRGAKLPACDLDFGDVKNLYLDNADLSHATSIKFPKETERLVLERAKLPACDLDFSGTKELYLNYADLSHATSIKFSKKMKKLHLRGAKLPACDLDFSGIKELRLDGADLSRATSIKYTFKYAFVYGTEKILQSVQQKLKNMRLIQNAKNQNDSE